MTRHARRPAAVRCQAAETAEAQLEFRTVIRRWPWLDVVDADLYHRCGLECRPRWQFYYTNTAFF